jgi:DNA invertase Pin-like site-specific DNA recombinase
VGESSHRHQDVARTKKGRRIHVAKSTKPAPQVDEESPEGDDEPNKPGKQQIREAFAAGRTRREIADEFGLSYQRVYQVTKDMGGNAQPRTRVVVEESEALTAAGREDLIGKPRVEAIRELFDEGMKVGAIAKLLDCSYQVAFQATRGQRAALAGEDVESEDEESEDELLEDEDELDEEEDEE